MLFLVCFMQVTVHVQLRGNVGMDVCESFVVPSWYINTRDSHTSCLRPIFLRCCFCVMKGYWIDVTSFIKVVTIVKMQH